MSKIADGEQIYAWILNQTFPLCHSTEIIDGSVVPTVAGETAYEHDTGVINISKDGENWNAVLYTGILNRYTNIGKLTNSAGTLKAIASNTSGYRTQVTPAVGDIMYLYFIADGTETQLQITTQKDTACAKWDLYVNGVVDGSPYDDYAASPTTINRAITLTAPNEFVKGLNTIELRATTNTAPSTDYGIRVLGASIQ